MSALEGDDLASVQAAAREIMGDAAFDLSGLTVSEIKSAALSFAFGRAPAEGVETARQYVRPGSRSAEVIELEFHKLATSPEYRAYAAQVGRDEAELLRREQGRAGGQ